MRKDDDSGARRPRPESSKRAHSWSALMRESSWPQFAGKSGVPSPSLPAGEECGAALSGRACLLQSVLVGDGIVGGLRLCTVARQVAGQDALHDLGEAQLAPTYVHAGGLPPGGGNGGQCGPSLLAGGAQLLDHGLQGVAAMS